MRCFTCERWSIAIFCKHCQKHLLMPSLTKRKIGTLEVISFFNYAEIESLILSKYQAYGHRIYKGLAKLSFAPFAKELNESQEEIMIIGIDENVKSGYSHVAVLTHAMKNHYIKVQHASLMAQNKVKYAGKDLEFRLNNPRNFSYKGKKNINAILVDDIITTGLTLQEAHKVLIAHDVNVLFALTLANARE